MRRRVIVAVTAALVACGSSGGGTALSGTLAGAPFSPIEGGALIVPPTDCTVSLPGVGTSNVHFSGLLIGFGSYAGLCNFIATNGQCAEKANATLANVEIVKGGLSQTQSGVAPGTYPVTTGNPTPDANGNFKVVAGAYNKTSTTCASTSASDANAGAITVSSVTSTTVTGSVANLVFDDASHLNGDFTVPICNFTFDLCARFNATCTSTPCLP
jgi:hypothetical protein